MKKVYIKPTTLVINVASESVLALSTQGATEITNDNWQLFDPASREERIDNPNLWKQGW